MRYLVFYYWAFKHLEKSQSGCDVIEKIISSLQQRPWPWTYHGTGTMKEIRGTLVKCVTTHTYVNDRTIKPLFTTCVL